MEISDFIPSYPELNDDKFNDKIAHKKEFNYIDETSKLWRHQQLLARFLSPYTPYQTQLLFHTPGTGKTCAASAIVEINKLDPLIRKPVLVIVPNDILVRQWKQIIAFICTDNEYVPDKYYSQDPLDKLTSREKISRLNKCIKTVYHVTTIERMRREIDKLNNVILRNKYSNTIIIIDEAHNLRIQLNTTKKEREASKSRYQSYHRFLHTIVNNKILLLTGTPMYDRIEELPGIMNLILPIDNQLPIGKAFKLLYIQTLGKQRKIKNEKKLMNYFIGRVSYVREGGNFPKRIDMGNPIWTNFIKTVECKLSNIQLKGYLEAYNLDLSRKKSALGLWKNSRQAAVFVYKKNDQYLWGTDATNILVKKFKAFKTLNINKKNIKFKELTIIPEYKDDIIKNLETYSSKFKKIIDFCLSHKNEPIFIFTPLVSGTGGAIFLGLIFNLFGYKMAIGNEKTTSLRYSIITGQNKSGAQREMLVNTYNSKQNIHGDIIHVMISTKAISEGTSFVNVKHEIVISPYWNNSGTEQAIGRGLRENSLEFLPQKDRVVTIQQLAINSNNLKEENNIDAHMYKMSENKDFSIKSGERVLKKVSWDCAINYDRNVRDIDDDYSRNCDYQKCNYTCYQTKSIRVKTKPKWEYHISDNDMIENTYLLYYSKPELLNIVKKIKKIFSKKFFVDINTLKKIIKEHSFKMLILAIEYIIENNVTIYNKWGDSCFMNNRENILYLNNISTDGTFLGSWYAMHPYANKKTPLSMVIDNEIINKDMNKIRASFKTKKDIEKLSQESKIMILELLVILKNKGIKKLDNYLSLFDDNVFTSDNIIIHNLFKEKSSDKYVDFIMGENGHLKCFKNNKWEICDKDEENMYSSNIKKVTQEDVSDIINNKFKVYGIITNDNKFQIVDKRDEPSDADDRRKVYTGRVCGSWPKWKIIDLYLHMKIPPSVSLITGKNKDSLLNISNKQIKSLIPKNADIDTLRLIYTLTEQKISDLCIHLRQWFIDNQLVIFS